MNNPDQIAVRFREVLLNGKWVANTNYRDILSGLSWEQATRKIESLNTMNELLLTLPPQAQLHSPLAHLPMPFGIPFSNLQNPLVGAPFPHPVGKGASFPESFLYTVAHLLCQVVFLRL